MEDIKKHMIGKQIKTRFDCDDCGFEFTTGSTLKLHIESNHTELGGSVIEDSIKKITPDQDFLTQNTKYLGQMLKNVPLESLYIGPDEYQKDVEEILNEKVELSRYRAGEKFKCDKCRFKAACKKALYIHNKFVHDLNFHICDICSIKTKTTAAMKAHKWNSHKLIVTYKEHTKPEEKTKKN